MNRCLVTVIAKIEGHHIRTWTALQREPTPVCFRYVLQKISKGTVSRDFNIFVFQTKSVHLKKGADALQYLFPEFFVCLLASLFILQHAQKFHRSP
jgi:hypothetical protein